MSLFTWINSLPGALKKYAIISAITSVLICTGFYFIFIQPNMGPNAYVSINEVNEIIIEKMLKTSDVESFLSGKYK